MDVCGILCIVDAPSGELAWEGSQNNFSYSYILVEKSDAIPQGNYSTPPAVSLNSTKGRVSFSYILWAYSKLSNPHVARR
jgi:hypothetical protein